MAIKWRTKISILDRKKKNVSVTLERIDDDDPANIKVLESFAVLDALIDTPERKQQVFDELERQYREKKQEKIDDTETIGTLGDDLKNSAEGWEAG